MSGKRWTPYEIELMERSRNPCEIAQLTGRSVHAVRTKMSARKIKSVTRQGRKPKYTSQQRAEIVDAYMGGMTQKEVSQKFGIPTSTTENIIANWYKRGVNDEI